jgi:hypothetical protein
MSFPTIGGLIQPGETLTPAAIRLVVIWLIFALSRTIANI